MGELTVEAGYEVVIEIGGMPISVCAQSPEFVAILQDRYVGFLNPGTNLY